MKVAIMTDSNSGITQQDGFQLGIRVVPMPFTIEGEEYFEDISLTQNQFYEKLLSDVSVSTSQPSIGFVMSIWDELLKEYDQVVYIPMSSGLSESCASAARAAEADYKGKVFVVNNQRISVTQKRSVLHALELAKKGYTGQEIHDILIQVKFQSDIYIMVDTLKYLRKGGRITPAAAAVGNLLKIKPVLRIFGEKLDKYRMMNRTLENAKRIMIEAARTSIQGFLKEPDGRTDNVSIDVAYTGVDRRVADEFVQIIKDEFHTEDILCEPLPLSISCHIGDGALAIAVTKHLPDSLLK